MAGHPDLVQPIKDATSAVTAWQKALKQADEALKAAMKPLAAALKARKYDSVQAGLEPLNKATQALELASVADSQLIEKRMLAPLESDERCGAAEKAVIGKLRTMVGDGRSKVQTTITAARALEVKAEHYVNTGGGDTKAMEYCLTVMNSNVTSVKRSMSSFEARLAEVETLAREAVQSRDDLELKKLVKEVTDFWGQGVVFMHEYRDFGDRFEGLIEQPGWPSAKEKVWRAELKDYRASLAAFDADVVAFDKRVQALKSLKIEPLDTRRLANVLELDGSQAAELAKALKGDIKGLKGRLQALGKKLKTKLDGDAMFQRLRKEKVVA